jgi:hypothetical protein
MASDVQIAKLALQHIGDRFDISALTEQSVEAEQVNLIFDDTRDWLLRQHPWNFATKYVSPAALSGTPPALYDYMYTYPTDAVRIISITDPLGVNTIIKFEVARNSDNTRVILTDQIEPEFKYTYRETTSSHFDPEFTMAFTYALAAKLAMPLVGDRELASDMDLKAQRIISAAEETDSNEGFAEEAPDADWITARL